MKRDQLNASSMPDAEKESLPGVLSFIPKQGSKENPGVFLRGRGLLQKETYLVPCIVSAGAAAGEGQSPDAASEVHRLWQKLPVFPLHSGSLLPLQHAPEGPQLRIRV